MSTFHFLTISQLTPRAGFAWTSRPRAVSERCLYQGFKIVSEAFFRELLVLKDDARAFDVSENASLQPAFHGIAGQIIGGVPSPGVQERLRVDHPGLGKLSGLTAVHRVNSPLRWIDTRIVSCRVVIEEVGSV